MASSSGETARLGRKNHDLTEVMIICDHDDHLLYNFVILCDNVNMSTVKTGPYELIEAGTVQILTKEVTSILFGTISIVFEFGTDDNSSESSIRANTTDKNTIKFMLININNPTYGTTDFVQFGKEAGGKGLYISFRVNSLNDKNVRSLEYSIFKK